MSVNADIPEGSITSKLAPGNGASVVVVVGSIVVVISGVVVVGSSLTVVVPSVVVVASENVNDRSVFYVHTKADDCFSDFKPFDVPIST